jgi:hypothetical protein
VGQDLNSLQQLNIPGVLSYPGVDFLPKRSQLHAR